MANDLIISNGGGDELINCNGKSNKYKIKIN